MVQNIKLYHVTVFGAYGLIISICHDILTKATMFYRGGGGGGNEFF